MKTAQVEKEFGIPRKTLFYDEDAGLLHPARHENGYREYTDNDLARLRMILLMRGMELPLADIRAVLDGSATFRDVLCRQEKQLRAEAEKIGEAHAETEYILQRQLPPADYGTMLKGRQHGGRGKVCICRRKYRSDYIRMMRKGILLSVLMFWFWLFGYSAVLRSVVPFWAALLNWIAPAAVIFWLVIRQEPFLEFDEQGVRFPKEDARKKIMWYFLGVMQGKDEDFFRCCAYEQIRLVKVRTVRRYAMPASPSHYVMPQVQIDYRLQLLFADGTGYRIDFPYTFRQDQQFCAAILLQKAQETDDPDGVLNLMAEGKNLTAEMNGRA